MKLHENWKLLDFAPEQRLSLGAHAPDYDDGDWVPTVVPRDVHTSLVRARRIQPLQKLYKEELEITVPGNSISRTVHIPASALSDSDLASRYL